MPGELSFNEIVEAMSIVFGLDASDYLFKDFSEWLNTNGFIIDSFGETITYKGKYGYVQFEWLIIGGRNLVVNCIYISFADAKNTRVLELEGISISGKSFSTDVLALLKQERFVRVERFVKKAFEELVFRPVELKMRIREDLKLDEYDIPEIIAKLEGKYNCIIPDHAAESFMTVEDVINYIRREIGTSA